jgi:signal transduction histidine kinase
VGSVRARAAFGATAVVAFALIAAGVAMVTMLRADLTEQVRLRAEVAARDIAAQLATDTPFDELRLEGQGPVQVVDEEGRVVAVSEGLESITGTASREVTPEPVPGRSPAPPSERPDDDQDDDDQDDDDQDDDDQDDDPDDDDRDDDENGAGGSRIVPGEVGEDIATVEGSATVAGQHDEYLFAVVQAVTTRGEEVTVYAGAPLGVERTALDTVRTSMLVGIPALLGVVGLVTWLVTRRALRPVEGIRREMAAITRSEDLSRRVPVPASRDEIGRLARTTNETLAALESSVERQRRFVADASHELRSPIASLRTQLEVGEAHPELLDVSGAVKDTIRLQDLAADLLLLARLDAGERPLAHAVDLAGLVTAELADRTGDRIRVRADELAHVTVNGSRGQLARVLRNLLDNAQRHARSRVRVTLREDGGEARLEVADDGPGVPEADRERIFERFVRLDDARSRDDGGAGLGLAIARDVATRHGGSLTAGRAPEGGALFVLRLPVAGG